MGAPVWIEERIWTVFSSRIRLPMALLMTSSSRAGTRPCPSAVGTRRWEITARSDSESIART